MIFLTKGEAREFSLDISFDEIDNYETPANPNTDILGFQEMMIFVLLVNTSARHIQAEDQIVFEAKVIDHYDSILERDAAPTIALLMALQDFISASLPRHPLTFLTHLLHLFNPSENLNAETKARYALQLSHPLLLDQIERILQILGTPPAERNALQDVLEQKIRALGDIPTFSILTRRLLDYSETGSSITAQARLQVKRLKELPEGHFIETLANAAPFIQIRLIKIIAMALSVPTTSTLKKHSKQASFALFSFLESVLPPGALPGHQHTLLEHQECQYALMAQTLHFVMQRALGDEPAFQAFKLHMDVATRTTPRDLTLTLRMLNQLKQDYCDYFTEVHIQQQRCGLIRWERPSIPTCLAFGTIALVAGDTWFDSDQTTPQPTVDNIFIALETLLLFIRAIILAFSETNRGIVHDLGYAPSLGTFRDPIMSFLLKLFLTGCLVGAMYGSIAGATSTDDDSPANYIAVLFFILTQAAAIAMGTAAGAQLLFQIGAGFGLRTLKAYYGLTGFNHPGAFQQIEETLHPESTNDPHTPLLLVTSATSQAKKSVRFSELPPSEFPGEPHDDSPAPPPTSVPDPFRARFGYSRSTSGKGQASQPKH